MSAAITWRSIYLDNIKKNFPVDDRDYNVIIAIMVALILIRKASINKDSNVNIPNSKDIYSLSENIEVWKGGKLSGSIGAACSNLRNDIILLHKILDDDQYLPEKFQKHNLKLFEQKINKKLFYRFYNALNPTNMGENCFFQIDNSIETEIMEKYRKIGGNLEYKTQNIYPPIIPKKIDCWEKIKEYFNKNDIGVLEKFEDDHIDNENYIIILKKIHSYIEKISANQKIQHTEHMLNVDKKIIAKFIEFSKQGDEEKTMKARKIITNLFLTQLNDLIRIVCGIKMSGGHVVINKLNELQDIMDKKDLHSKKIFYKFSKKLYLFHKANNKI